MQVSANATSLLKQVRFKYTNGNPIEGIEFDDAVAISYRLQSSSTWVTPTLAEGTLGTYIENSLVEDPDGDGLYQWCPPDVVVVPNTTTLIRAVYAGNDPQYSLIEATLPAANTAGSVVITSGVYMCGRGDLEQVFGTVAIARWADLDNDGDEDQIETRINYRIAMADNYLRATLGNSYWTMPSAGDTVPAILVYNCAVLAGVYLYEGRGVQDYNAAGYAQHQLSFHKTNVDNFIKGVLVGSINLSPLLSGQLMTAPETVNAF